MIIAVIMASLAFSSYPKGCIGGRQIKTCNTFCGDLNISIPFRLKSQPRYCGEPGLELTCNNNQATVEFNYGKFYVQEISYDNQTARLVDASLETNKCSIPQSSIPQSSLSLSFLSQSYFFPGFHREQLVVFNGNFSYLLNCTKQVTSSLYVDASSCDITGGFSTDNFFYLLDSQTPFSAFDPSCTIQAMVPLPSSLRNITGMPMNDIYRKLLMGFRVSWLSEYDSIPFGLQICINILRALVSYVLSFIYFFKSGFSIPGPYLTCVIVTGFIFLARYLLGVSCLAALVTYKLRRRHLSMDDTIEDFLQRQNNFMPIRYSYYEIKKMTEGFKDKLGQGGFGSVFKGKLRSGKLVAIKILGNSKAKGQDFINEVATIGRIHHVNVAQLVGFCVEGSKLALVYEFMPNGSLDKIIFSRDENTISLNWEQMFDVVLGVARGMEYLHQGCDMQILHFDIKPHNILLDQKFIPKISDFGLAKLNPVDDSIVSLTAARGTVGYIAPELFYKYLGDISYKADVYSFGMLLMEMVGRRKNLNASIEQSSQIYFPSWIYDRYHQGEEIELEDVTDDSKKLVRKMVIVAFWCIQTKPVNRPSMKNVIEMLESEVDRLEIPPKHSLFSLERSEDEVDKNA